MTLLASRGAQISFWWVSESVGLYKSGKANRVGGPANAVELGSLRFSAHLGRFCNGSARIQEGLLAWPSSLRPIVFAKHGCWQRKKRFQHHLRFIVKRFSQGKSILVPRYYTHTRGHRDERSLKYVLGMPSYLVKPRESTVLSHKKYHEISSPNLLLSWTVGPPLPGDIHRS